MVPFTEYLINYEKEIKTQSLEKFDIIMVGSKKNHIINLLITYNSHPTHSTTIEKYFEESRKKLFQL